ncbi:hypothetical protein BHE74_00041467 [Ensete ventricosum]|nr:hypothetical protein BHE74_00041467 [Ensete ventricosum]
MHPLRFPNNGIRAKQRQQGGGAASHGQPLSRADQPRPGRDKASSKGSPAAPARDDIVRGHSCLQRGTRKGLSPAGVAPPAVGVAAPWQGGCQRARAAAACAGAAVACAGAVAAMQRGKRS